MAFDIDDPDLPAAIADKAFRSGGYPYDERMKRKRYEGRLELLQIELLKLQRHLRKTGGRLVIVFEGRDAAGKGGTIARIMQHLNPRHARVVALSKPTETERGQWYFQRYIDHMPTRGGIVIFDRSWYNRAGVEPVMGFASDGQVDQFLDEAPNVERLLVGDGIHLVKLWLEVGKEMQLRRLHDRRHSPLKSWKLSPIDLKGLGLWHAYGEARDAMLERTHSPHAPWTVIRSNDKLRLRLNAIRVILGELDYEGRDNDAVGEIDGKIVHTAPFFLTMDDR